MLDKRSIEDPRDRIGLCASCQHARIIRSDRGSVFYQCRLAAANPRFPQYPRLPVLTCEGYIKMMSDGPRRDKG